MMDEKLTKRIQQWLETPEKERNIQEGATLLLKMNKNQVMYRNIIMFPKKYGTVLEKELQKRLNMRVQQVTHETVEQMRSQVGKMKQLQQDNPASGFKAGKRADHDLLPDEIQALYVENKSIVQRMRDVHAQLRILTTKPGICPDSDRYPFLKDLIALDKRLHENWARYDAYDTTKAAEEQQEVVLDAREESKRAVGFINLNKKRYANNPTEELKAKLAAAYAKVINPSEKITAALKELGVIE